MAKEIALGKRAKISKAEQNIIVSVLGASILLGAAISLTVHFIKQISFNAQVIAAEEEAIVSYSNVIRDIGVCKSPEGNVYTDKELKDCKPDSIEIEQIPGTLRANILNTVAANPALNSVPKAPISICNNPATGMNYTYAQLERILNDAKGETENIRASQLMKTCSALRVIPDALPAFKNEEALLASLNKISLDSGFEPDNLAPSSSTGDTAPSNGLNGFSISLSAKNEGTGVGVAATFLSNVERSIREFDIQTATFSWEEGNTLSFSADANVYYMIPSKVVESDETIDPETGPSRSQVTEEVDEEVE